jgi:hypothetical protein
VEAAGVDSDFFEVTACVNLLPADAGGLVTAMPASTRSMLLVFSSSTLDGQTIGASIQSTSGDPFAPGAVGLHTSLTFWAGEDARRLATPGADSALWYDGRLVGTGNVDSA